MLGTTNQLAQRITEISGHTHAEGQGIANRLWRTEHISDPQVTPTSHDAVSIMLGLSSLLDKSDPGAVVSRYSDLPFIDERVPRLFGRCLAKHVRRGATGGEQFVLKEVGNLISAEAIGGDKKFVFGHVITHPTRIHRCHRLAEIVRAIHEEELITDLPRERRAA